MSPVYNEWGGGVGLRDQSVPQVTPRPSSCLCSPLRPWISVLIGAFKGSPPSPSPTSRLTLKIRLPRGGGGFPPGHRASVLITHREPRPPVPACCPSHCDTICSIFSVPFPSLCSFLPSSSPSPENLLTKGQKGVLLHSSDHACQPGLQLRPPQAWLPGPSHLAMPLSPSVTLSPCSPKAQETGRAAAV